MITKPQDRDFIYFDWDRTKTTFFINNQIQPETLPTLRNLIETTLNAFHMRDLVSHVWGGQES